MHLQDLRGFSDQTFRFRDGFNVLSGDNGTGKAAALEAMAFGVGSFLLGIRGKPHIPRIWLAGQDCRR